MKLTDKMNDEFDFNQDSSLEFNDEYRSPDGRYQKIILNGKNKKVKTDFRRKK